MNPEQLQELQKMLDEREELVKITPEEFILIARRSYEHFQGKMEALQDLVNQVNFGTKNNLRVDIFHNEENGNLMVHVEPKPPMGFVVDKHV